MFATDILETLNNLNLKLQGKGLFAHEILKPVKSFIIKIGLLARKAGEGKFNHFPLLGKQRLPQYVNLKKNICRVLRKSSQEDSKTSKK